MLFFSHLIKNILLLSYNVGWFYPTFSKRNMNKWDCILNHLLKELITDIPLFYWWDNLYGTYFLIFALLQECKFKKKVNPKPVTCSVVCCLVYVGRVFWFCFWNWEVFWFLKCSQDDLKIQKYICIKECYYNFKLF